LLDAARPLVPPSTCSTTVRTAAPPISGIGWRMTVSGGTAHSATQVSS
jgi:hypothetical protein